MASAYEMPGFSWTAIAGEDLTASQFCGIDAEHGTGDAILPTQGARCIGIVQNKPDDQEPATIVSSGISKCQVGVTGVAAGDSVTVDDDGTIIQAAANDIPIGIAMQTHAAGEMGTVLLLLSPSQVAGS